MSTFKIGQKVVCIDISRKGRVPCNLILDNIYTICGFEIGPKTGQLGLVLSEVDPPEGYKAYYQWRFEPLKYDIIPNKSIIEEMIEEKCDIPIKEPEKIKS